MSHGPVRAAALLAADVSQFVVFRLLSIPASLLAGRRILLAAIQAERLGEFPERVRELAPSRSSPENKTILRWIFAAAVRCWRYFSFGCQLRRMQDELPKDFVSLYERLPAASLDRRCRQLKKRICSADDEFQNVVVRPKRVLLISVLLLLCVMLVLARSRPASPIVPLAKTDLEDHTIAILATFVDWDQSGSGERKLRKRVVKGTGVIVRGGFVLTNRHVVDESVNPSRASETTPGMERTDSLAVARGVTIGRKQSTQPVSFIEADIVAISKSDDLALLKPRKPLESPILVAENISEITRGQELSIIVSADGVPADEIRTAQYHKQTSTNRFRISGISILPSWSGSPVFLKRDLDAGLIGMVSMAFPSESGRTGGMAVSHQAIRRFLKKHEDLFAKPSLDGAMHSVTIESMQLSAKAIALGGGAFDGLSMRVLLFGGADRNHCAWSRTLDADADSNGRVILDHLQMNVPWKRFGRPLRIEVWEKDLVYDDPVDHGTFNSMFPQDAQFPWKGKSVRLTHGSTVTFR